MTRRTRLLLILVMLAATAAHAAGPEPKYKAPRTENGQPNLQGVWNFNSGVPLQRPPAFAGRKFFTKEEFEKQRAVLRNVLASVAKFAPLEQNIGIDWLDTALHVDDLRTSLITYPENGRLPALVEDVRRLPTIDEFIAALSDTKAGPSALFSALGAFGAGKKDSHDDFTMADRCLFGADVPLLPQVTDNHTQIIQARDYVALLTEGTRRIIVLDSTPQAADKLRSWSGASRGHWEGETLVVETGNFNNRSQSFAGAGTSRDKVVTERFTRTSNNVLEYSATVVDPKTFQDKVEFGFPMARVDAQIYESACHEGNYAMSNMLSAARKAEQDAAAAAKQATPEASALR